MQKTSEQVERLVRSRIQLLLDYPFFGQLAMYLKLVEDNSLQTAATDGNRYLFNHDFVSKLNDKELNFLTAHETLHAALGHLWRWEGKNKLIFNHAADYVINSMIIECDSNQSFFKMIEGGLYDVKFKGMSTEEVYDILINDEDYVMNAQLMYAKGNGGTIDSHEIWSQASKNNDDGDGEGEGEGDISHEEDWKGRVVQAAQASEGKGKGSLPSLIKRMIKDFISPQKNWRQLLAEFVQHEIVDYGFSPPDKRFSEYDFFLPDWSEPEDTVKNIVFAVDTSGSIGEKHFQVFISEVVGCMQQFGGKVKGKLIYCDSRIASNGIYDLEDAHQSLPVGGGGTDFNPVFNWINENLDDCVGLVYLTDGEGCYPKKEPNFPTLWVLTQEYDVPFGIKTEIKI